MDIITSKTENFDNFVYEIKNLTKEQAILFLENKDKEIASSRELKRYKIIGLRPRTILTTIGIITYKRRYYYDKYDEEYIYLLDNQLELPKYTRISNELRIQVLKLASEMTYRVLGRNISDEFTIGKSTVYKIVRDTTIKEICPPIFRNNEDIVHLQIDEKYIGMIDKKNKGKYYTATIFAGEKFIKSKRILLNKTVLSSYKLDDLEKKIKDNLINRYKVKEDEKIFISGDFASYIKKFKSRIDDICKPIYVPDKFHVKKALKDLFGWKVDDRELNLKENIDFIFKSIDEDTPISYKGLKGVIKDNADCFKPYLDEKYLGCSQEAMNSHVYAPRFGKYQNRFNPKTIEKLSLIKEAFINKAVIKIVSNKRIIEDKKAINLEKYHISFQSMPSNVDTTKIRNRISIVTGLLLK